MTWLVPDSASDEAEAPLVGRSMLGTGRGDGGGGGWLGRMVLSHNKESMSGAAWLVRETMPPIMLWIFIVAEEADLGHSGQNGTAALWCHIFLIKIFKRKKIEVVCI